MLVRDFESGDLAGFRRTGSANWPVVVDNPVRDGSYAMKSYVNRTDRRPYRTEVIPNDDDGSMSRVFYHEEYYFGISIMLPDDYIVALDEEAELLLQFHHEPDDWSNPGECVYPLFALRANTDQWNVNLQGVQGGRNWSTSLVADVGKWTDFTVRIVVSKGSDGLLQVWRNGELFADWSGSTTKCEFRHSPYISFGVYKWSWRPEESPQRWTSVEERTYYHDEYRVGKTYEEVQPTPVPGPVEPPIPPLPPPLPEPPEIPPTQLEQAVTALENRVDSLENWAANSSRPFVKGGL